MRMLFLFLLVALAGCSSAPPVPDTVNDRKNRASDYLKFGRQAFLEAQYEQALSFYLVAVDLNTAVDHLAGMAVSWNSVATAQAALGRQAEAQAALRQAEFIARVSKDRTAIGQVAVNLVEADLAAGRFDEARARLTALQPFDNTAEGAALFHSLGTLEKAANRDTEALAALERAFNLHKDLKLKQDAAGDAFVIASIYSRSSNWKETERNLKQAMQFDKDMENTLGIGQDLRALGTVAGKQAQWQQAFDLYVRAYRLFVAAALPDQQKRTLELLIPVAAQLASPEQARYQALLDALGTPKK